jgi:tRNA G46 methylase TrmB
VLLLVVVLLFTSRTLSPVPYFPSNQKDMKNILEALDIKNDQVIIDLGAGDGWVIFAAARYAFDHHLNTQFIALDINPILVCMMWLRRLTYPNKANIMVLRGDFFKINYKHLLPKNHGIKPVFYLYISPWFLEQVVDKIYKELPTSRVVSYFYSVKSYKSKERILGGVHPTHIYE